MQMVYTFDLLHSNLDTQQYKEHFKKLTNLSLIVGCSKHKNPLFEENEELYSCEFYLKQQQVSVDDLKEYAEFIIVLVCEHMLAWV